MFNPNGKVAVVAGSASGIGATTAQRIRKAAVVVGRYGSTNMNAVQFNIWPRTKNSTI
jgi:NAD(P)-dependent dehydrogenase (short-subunit alcohol dehydrogenase family)